MDSSDLLPIPPPITYECPAPGAGHSKTVLSAKFAHLADLLDIRLLVTVSIDVLGLVLLLGRGLRLGTVTLLRIFVLFLSEESHN